MFCLNNQIQFVGRAFLRNAIKKKMKRFLKSETVILQGKSNKITLNFTRDVMQEIKTSLDSVGSTSTNGVGTNEGSLSTDNTTNGECSAPYLSTYVHSYKLIQKQNVWQLNQSVKTFKVQHEIEMQYSESILNLVCLYSSTNVHTTARRTSYIYEQSSY